ncbi:MAG: alkaline phosphatase D family protein [Caulobacterales bacterium]
MFKTDLTRRGAFGAALAGTAAACAPTRATAYEGAARFGHGVASGDPRSDSVVIWTRVSPEKPGPVPVRWVVTSDPKLRRVVATGETTTDEARDYTVKIDVQGLKPGRKYHYGFVVGKERSPVGVAKTLPEAGVEQIRFAVVSCSNYPFGYFNAYKSIAETDGLDAVLHLGDYIYEYGRDGYGGEVGVKLGRAVQPPHEIVTLADYRTRFAQYRSDPDLQAAHAAAPWITIWDDHETTNDSWQKGAQNHQPKEGDWEVRKRAAIQAYFEWMPIRDPVAGRPWEAINRTFQFGDLVTLAMLETRLLARVEQLDYAKDLPQATTTWDMTAKPPKPVAPGALTSGQTVVKPTPFDVSSGAPVPILDWAKVQMIDPAKPPPGVLFLPDVAAFRAKLENPERQLLGAEQEAWLNAEIAKSTAAKTTWRLIGNQVIMARVDAPDLSALPEPIIAAVEKSFPPLRKFLALTKLGMPMNLDAWDGYPAQRDRLLETFLRSSPNTLVVTGDTHAAWANELDVKRGGARAGVEFGTTSVTSPGFGDLFKGVDFGGAIMGKNPVVKWTDQVARGYLLLTLTKSQAKADFMKVSNVLSKDYKLEVEARFKVAAQREGTGAIEKA